MRDPHHVVRQHHHRVALAGQVGEQLGVAFEGVAGQVQRLLGQGRGDDGIHLAGLRHACGALDRAVGPFATGRADAALDDRRLHRAHVDALQPGAGRRCQAQLLVRQVECPGAAHHLQLEAPGGDPLAQQVRGLDDDFRPDAGGVAHGDRDPGNGRRGGHAALSFGLVGGAGG
jgi:hypothetical protein